MPTVMNYEQIEHLLNKYFEGETSLAEERQLHDFFSGDAVPPHLKVYAPLFLWSEEAARNGITLKDFDAAVTGRLTDTARPAPKRLHLRFHWYMIPAAAAVILILIALFMPAEKVPLMRMFSSKMTDTFDNPKEAYAATVKALLLVSEKLNTGTSGLQGLSEFDKGLDDASKLNTMNTGLQEASKIDIMNTGLNEVAKISHLDNSKQKN
jgi:hypothetical protein